MDEVKCLSTSDQLIFSSNCISPAMSGQSDQLTSSSYGINPETSDHSYKTKQCLSTDSGLSLSPSPTATPTCHKGEEEEDEYSTIFEAVVAASETSEDCEGRLFSEDDERKPKQSNDSKHSPTLFWNPPNVSDRLERYSHNPKKIENYVPGSCSLADLQSVFFKRSRSNQLVEKSAQGSSYTESGLSSQCKIRRTGSLMSPSTPVSDPYKNVQSGGDIPFEGLRCHPSTKRFQKSQSPSTSPICQMSPNEKHSPFSVPLPKTSNCRPLSSTNRFFFPSSQQVTKRHSSDTACKLNESGYASLSCLSPSPQTLSPHAVDAETNRKRMEAQNAVKKRQLARIIDETKARRQVEEIEKNLSRRHSDFSASVTSPVAPNRYDVDYINDSVFSECGDDPPNRSDRHKRARALYSFTAQNRRELSFHRGDTIFVIKQIDQNWVQGQRHGAVGLLPISYIEIIDSKMDQVRVGDQEQKYKEFAYAKFNFEAFDSTQLAFKKNDVLKVLERINLNWFRGQSRDGRSGLVPVSYVKFDTEESCETQLGNMLSAKASLRDELKNWISSSNSICGTVKDEGDDPIKPCDLTITTDLDHLEFTHHDTVITTTRIDSNQLTLPQPEGDIITKSNSDHLIIPHSDHVIKTPSLDNGHQFLNNENGGKHNSEKSLENMDKIKDQFMGNSKPSVITMEDCCTDELAGSGVMNELDDKNSINASKFQSESSDLDFMSVFDSCSHLWSNNKTIGSVQVRPELASCGIHGKDENKFKKENRLLSSNLQVVNGHDLRNLYEHQRTTSRSNDHTPYIVVHEYKPLNNDELLLEPGELIYVTEMFDDGWYVGIAHRSNKFGIFPSRCVSKQFDIRDDTRSTKL